MTSPEAYNPALFTAEHWMRGVPDSERTRLIATARAVPTDCTSVLEVGCGDGRLLTTLRSTGFKGHLVGVEPSTAGVLRVRERSVLGTASSLPFRSSSVDAVLCCEVLEHLPEEMMDAAIAELKRVSRRYILVTVPNREQLDLNRTLCASCGYRFHISGHLRRFDAAQLKSMLITRSSEWRVLSVDAIPGSSRTYHPMLLRLKQRVFGLMPYATGVTCPRCGTATPAIANRRWLRAALAAANLLLSPRKTSGGWLLALLQRT